MFASLFHAVFYTIFTISIVGTVSIVCMVGLGAHCSPKPQRKIEQRGFWTKGTSGPRALLNRTSCPRSFVKFSGKEKRP